MTPRLDAALLRVLAVALIAGAAFGAQVTALRDAAAASPFPARSACAVGDCIESQT